MNNLLKANFKFITYTVILLLLAIIAFLLKGKGRKDEFIQEKIKFGNIENTVTCTGIINAKGTVEVGSRISGTINKLYADYNDSVFTNKVMGILDTVILSKEYSEIKALTERIKNKLILSRKEFNNATILYNKKLISNREYLNYKTNYMIDSSDYKAERSKLEKSRATIAYAYIRSPINGVVIDRNVEEGQTIAANFMTPVLYVIAKDLNKMEILVSVDESDIGSIKVGQKGRFTVNAYPDSTFWGIVRELRMKPKMVQNVVTYIVVIDTANKKHLLLPGMTATIDFIVGEKKNVLMVPISAIRFNPSKELLLVYNERNGRNVIPFFNKKDMNNSNKEANIWFLDKNGELTMEKVITGASDVKNVEIINAKYLKQGMDVITSVKEQENTKAKEASGKKSNQIMGPSNSAPGGGGPPPG